MELLAHEVTHSVQQSRRLVGKGIDPDAGLEQEATRMGRELSHQLIERKVREPARPVDVVQQLSQVNISNSSTTIQRLAQAAQPDSWDLKLVGSLATKNIFMAIRNDRGKLHGNYHYAGNADKMTLEGEIKAGGDAILVERTQDGKATGKFTGKVTGHNESVQYRGIWSSSTREKTFGFSAKYASRLAPLPSKVKDSKNYGGRIGDYEIRMRANFNQGRVSGYYYYAKQGSSHKIKLTGTLTGRKLRLLAGAEIFSADIATSLDQIQGLWELNGKSLPFSIGVESASADSPSSVNPEFISEIMAALPKAMLHDLDRYGNSVMSADFRTNPLYRRNVTMIVEECLKSGVTDRAQIAYIIVTAAHESAMGANMRERLWGSNVTAAQERRYFDNAYGPSGANPTRARKHGNVKEGDGYKYRGRGFVQLTWADNYANWTQKLGQQGYRINGQTPDLVNNPDLVAQNPQIAAAILVQGMREGSFRPAKGPLSQYVGHGRTNFIGARNTVNGDVNTNGIKMGRAAQALFNALQNTKLVSQPDPQERNDLRRKILASALAGLKGSGTVKIAYSCSAWTRQVVTQHVDPNRTLFGASALGTYNAFKKAGLTRAYSGTGDLQPGDILFWDVPPVYWHVAIYTGDGQVAGNHYAIYLQKYKEIKAKGRTMPGTIQFYVGNMAVYDGIDARGTLPLLQVAGKNPAAVATIPDGWRPKP
ncbi:hypothetical protein ACFSC4_08565 [Deinococcus malanensis]|uniref:hypothetical protein n=1 Tax=Deinococcus malanensis TaxID=1706855 RepID=UPI00363DEC3D